MPAEAPWRLSLCPAPRLRAGMPRACRSVPCRTSPQRADTSAGIARTAQRPAPIVREHAAYDRSAMKLAIMAMLLAFASTVSASDEALRAELSLLATKRIYFAHQSVGANILEGVADLARSVGAPVRIVQAPRAADVPAGAFGHFFVPENGAPLEKLANFETALGSGAGIDIALVKFCYV